ncbi:MAG: hypothetical protein HYS27_22875 [Deltaproteobacteria bacterium]|nr:hypothetical protein [Deltaproteobacteria bacterium]
MDRQKQIVLLVIALAGCQPNVGEPVRGSISGAVVKGPVAGATLVAYSVDARGRRAKEVGSAKSAGDATFTIDVGGHFGPTLACAKDGTFVEEATGGLVSLGPNELCALIDEQKLGEPTSGVLITPLTSMHASLTACLVESSRVGDLGSASASAAELLNAFFSAGTPGFDLRATPVFDTTSATAPSLAADVWHGLLLAGLSESARQISLESDIDPGVRVTSATLTNELLRDLDDGACVFDGKGPAGTALAQASVPLSSNTLRGAPEGLALSVERFLVGTQNKTGIGVDEVKDLTAALTNHESPLFDDDGASNGAAPFISIAEPIEGPVAGTPAIRVLADDAAGIDELAFIAPQALVGAGTSACSSPIHCELTGTLNTALFPPGDVTITARATNVDGVSSDASVTVTIDNELPQITVTSPSAGTLSGTVSIAARAESAVGIDRFTVSAPGAVFLPACAPPATTTNCDREPDPTLIDILWDTTAAGEGALTLTFEATDVTNKTAFSPIEVLLDNVPTGTVAGVVELGLPVTGAEVTVFELIDGARGAVIGTATSNDVGEYIIDNASFVGAIDIVATGGAFEDSSTGQPLTLRAGQELAAAINVTVLGEDVIANVNAWTTLARKRAVVTQADSPSFAAAVTFNSNLVAGHFLRPGSLSLTSSSSANLLDDNPAASDSAAILALAHAGLSRVAAQVSIDAGGSPGQVTAIDLLDVLLLDLNDGVLDGTDTGSPLFLDQQSIASDPDVLRTRLAVGIDNFVKNAPFRDNGVVVLEAVRNSSSITSDALAGPGLLYDDISLDRSILFPADAPVNPFDQTPPTIELAFAAPNDATTFGSALDGVVAIIGTVSDLSGISSFDVLAPDVVDLFSPVADVRVEIDGSHAPNHDDVLARCGIEIGDPPFSVADPTREVCLCVESTDALANIAHGVHCFTRPRPIVTTDASLFVGPARGGVTFNAAGSFDLESCAGVVSQGGNSLGNAEAVAAGSTCNAFVPFTVPLAAGTAALDVDVVEIGGTVSRSTFTYTVDLEPPSVVINAPTAGSFRALPPAIVATAIDENLVSVTADVTSNAIPVVLGLVGTIGANNAVTFPAFTDTQPDGLRTIVVTAVDAAGNSTSAQQSYTKDTAAPALANLAAADGNPLRHFQLTATTAFATSPECSVFPFTGCIFNINGNTTTKDVVFRPTANSVDTYRRWQHLAGQLTNPSTLATPPVENRAPTLRLKTEPAVAVEARIDASCTTDNAAFENRSRGTFVANAVGLVDVPIADVQNLTFSPTLLREQTGAATLCLSMRPSDQAGNKGAITTHFFKYEATPAPLFMLWNAGGYAPGAFQEDVEAFDDGDDDEVLGGSGQGSAGRVFAHAYLVSPSTITNYSYVYELDDGTAPTIAVRHRETLHISRQRAFNWCYSLDGNDQDTSVDDEDDDLVNPDCIVANEANSPPNNPTWNGATVDQCSTDASWALYAPTGNTLLSASVQMEHQENIDGENDTTFSHSPADSYPTNADTIELGQTFNFNIPLPDVSLEVWSYNTVTGLPGTLIDSGESVSFIAGGSSPGSRHRLLLLRAPVPQNALTLKTATVLGGQLGTLGFNDTCTVRNSAGTFVAQMFALPSDHWVIADASLPSAAEPAPPRRLLWVKSGSFTECKGTSTNECRYGRYFDDYLDATWTWPSGRTIDAQGKIGGTIASASFLTQTTQAIPSGQTRELEQEQ